MLLTIALRVSRRAQSIAGDRRRLRYRESRGRCLGRRWRPPAQTLRLRRSDMMNRRAFLGGTLSAVTLEICRARAATAIAQSAAVQTSPEPLVWPVVTKLPAGVR